MYLSAGLCADELCDSAKVVIVCADQHSEKRRLCSAPIHIFWRLGAQLQLHWSLTARVCFCKTHASHITQLLTNSLSRGGPIIGLANYLRRYSAFLWESTSVIHVDLPINVFMKRAIWPIKEEGWRHWEDCTIALKPIDALSACIFQKRNFKTD